MQKILDIARENDILKDILNATITIKYPDSEEKIYTPLTYTISCKSNEAFNTTRAIIKMVRKKLTSHFLPLIKEKLN
ncbi:WD_0033/WD_0034 family tandem repeat-containing protein [Wolbachia endosymbiont of Drosophila innubila]